MKPQTLLLLLLATISYTPALAEKNPEENHVQVVLANGDTITGYIRSDLKTGLKNLFSKGGSILQYINVGEQPKGGETRRYHVTEVKEYRFLETSEAYPEGAVRVSEMLNTPKLWRSLNYTRGFAWELDRRDSGSILRWQVYENTGGRNSVSRLVPATGVKFKGAPGAFIVIVNGTFNDSCLLYYLKKMKRTDLYKAWNEYFHKGKGCQGPPKGAD
ncbi:MAG: hypothetical protein K2M12_00780 [Muribaculaceae bacterium]|nr:hypothetical protein [Muribaculaceae bacterium]